METRVYEDKIDINYEKIKNFWESRGSNNISLKSVLLGVDKKDNAQEKRNIKEIEIINSFLIDKNKYKILDIGCGIGRWANNLKDKIESYTGIDYAKSFVDFANNYFATNPNIKFYNMSASNIKTDTIGKDYNLIISTGVLMYINDKDLDKVFDDLLQTNSNNFYIQETISLLDTRLTLNEFKSKELETNYSAIYRTKMEYENIFKKHHLKILKTDLFLNDKTGGREETNARYWFLRRG